MPCRLLGLTIYATAFISLTNALQILNRACKVDSFGSSFACLCLGWACSFPSPPCPAPPPPPPPCTPRHFSVLPAWEVSIDLPEFTECVHTVSGQLMGPSKPFFAFVTVPLISSPFWESLVGFPVAASVTRFLSEVSREAQRVNHISFNFLV